MTTYTTLNKIRAKGPCADGWTKLLCHLGKTQGHSWSRSLLVNVNTTRCVYITTDATTGATCRSHADKSFQSLSTPVLPCWLPEHIR